MNLDQNRINPLFQIESFITAFDFRWNEDYIYTGEQHDFWEVVYVLDGSVEVAEDDRIYTLQKGDLILHAPMEFHKIRTLDRTKPHCLIFTFSISGILPSNLEKGLFHLTQEEADTFHQSFQQIYQFVHLDCDNVVGYLASLEFATFLLRLSASRKSIRKPSQSRQAQYYHLLVSTMRECVYENITLEELSHRCHIHTSHIKRLFQRYAGMSPKTYYIKMRAGEALNLPQSGLSVREASDRMNFSSPNYFSLFMKQQLGMSVLKYLKLHSNDET